MGTRAPNGTESVLAYSSSKDLNGRWALSVRVDRQLTQFYRSAENYRRYLPESAERRAAVGSLYRRLRRHFGRRVLDLGCGGGVLGAVLEPTGRTYVGIDANPDMIREARRAARERGSRQRFVLGDITRVPLAGRFDTLALLGNALGHLDVRDLEDLLRARRANVASGARFIVDYRDVVAMFWHHAWEPVYVERHKRGTVTCRTRSVDFERGRIHIRARPASRQWVVDYTQALWSPFVLEGIMRGQGWRLVARHPGHSFVTDVADPFSWTEVYRRDR